MTNKISEQENEAKPKTRTEGNGGNSSKSTNSKRKSNSKPNTRAEGSGHGEAVGPKNGTEQIEEGLYDSPEVSFDILDELTQRYKRELDGIRNKMEIAKSVLEKERESLEREKRDFEQQKIEMKKRNEIHKGSVKLNVGGQIFETTLTTLRSKKGTMLENMFSGYFPLERNEEGEVFIDRDPKHFRKILNYLTHGTLLYNSENEIELQELMLEMDYYGIPFPFSDGNVEKQKIESKTLLNGLNLHIYSNFKKNEVIFELENKTQKTALVQLEWENLQNLGEPIYHQEGEPFVFLYLKEKIQYCTFPILDPSKPCEYQYHIHPNTNFHEKRIEHTPLEKFNIIVESYKFDMILVLLVRNVGEEEKTFRVDWTLLVNMCAPGEAVQKKIAPNSYVLYSKLSISDFNLAWRYKWRCFINS